MAKLGFELRFLPSHPATETKLDDVKAQDLDLWTGIHFLIYKIRRMDQFFFAPWKFWKITWHPLITYILHWYKSGATKSSWNKLNQEHASKFHFIQVSLAQKNKFCQDWWKGVAKMTERVLGSSWTVCLCFVLLQNSSLNNACMIDSDLCWKGLKNLA